MSDYFVCPVCGTEVPIKAAACPECGSDDETGWSEDTIYDGVNLPEFEASYEEAFGDGVAKQSKSLFQNRIFMFIVAIIAVIIFLAVYLI